MSFIKWGDEGGKYMDTGCPNCETDAHQTDVESESHWATAFIYECPNCGCEFSWTSHECSHGLRGWALFVENAGDFSKSIHDSKDWWENHEE